MRRITMPFLPDWAEPYLPLFKEIYPTLEDMELKIELQDLLDNMRDTIGGSNPESLEAYIEHQIVNANKRRLKEEFLKISNYSSTDTAETICTIQILLKKLIDASNKHNYKDALTFSKQLQDATNNLQENYLANVAKESGVRIGENL